MERVTESSKMPRVGTLVAGRYRVERLLGQGGFAAVYLAEDQTAGGQLAIKILDPSKSEDPSFVKRFQQEVRLVRQLTHHNTVKIWDVGQMGGQVSTCYILVSRPSFSAVYDAATAGSLLTCARVRQFRTDTVPDTTPKTLPKAAPVAGVMC